MKRALILNFVRQDLIDRHASSALGASWTLLLPLANILIFTLVFSRLMSARLDSMGIEYLGNYSYSVYLITALLAWNAFAATLTRGTEVFHEKAALISKVNMPLLSLPLYIVISEVIMYGISMVFFAVFLVFIDFQWSFNWLWLPVILFIQQLLAFSLGLFCAIFSVFFRDIKTFITVIVQLWFWLTPIVYVITILPESWQTLLNFNPVYHLITAYRDTLVAGQSPNTDILLLVFILSSAFLALTLWIGKRLEKDIRDFI